LRRPAPACGSDAGVEAIELPHHPFFLATLSNHKPAPPTGLLDTR